LLLEELFLQQKNLTAEVRDAGCFILRDNEETFEL
jgi:hypothetical protein